MLVKIKKYSVRGVVDKVTTKEIVIYKPGDLDTDSNISITKKVAILDVGTKFNIARCLLKRGCEVTIYPAKTESRNDSCFPSGRHYADEWTGGSERMHRSH